jgi:hypothetical protein
MTMKLRYAWRIITTKLTDGSTVYGVTDGETLFDCTDYNAARRTEAALKALEESNDIVEVTKLEDWAASIAE